MFTKIRRNLALYGALGTFETQLVRLARATYPRIFRRHGTPSLQEFNGAGEISETTNQVIEKVLGLSVTSTQTDALRSEYRAILAEIAEAQKNRSFFFPSNYAVGSESGYLIYSLVRLLEPRVVVETGIANGLSTFIVLRAIGRNGVGLLVSTDVHEKAGGLVEHIEPNSWRREILRATDVRQDMELLLASLPAVDMFLHDSDHRYDWQLWEYRAARRHLQSGAILASDDVDASFAFIDFCREVNRRPVFLFDRRKMFGVVRLHED